MPPAVDVTLRAEHVLVVGSSGSGKSAWIKQQIKGAPRIVAWDPDGEYAQLRDFTTVRHRRDLARALAKAPRGRFAYVGQVNQDEFEFWSRCAFAWGYCIAVAEETADVTTPAKAPPGWGDLVRKGRKRGVQIYAVTQRPSESDKTIVANAARIHVGRMNRAKDRAYMAEELDIPVAQLAALKPLEWVERVMATGQILRGKVTF